jgi:hypothetical protein
MSNCINVTKHHVSAKSIAKRHWSLKVDHIAGLQRTEVGARIRFVAYVGIPIRRAIGSHNREAAAIHRNGCTEVGAFQHCGAVDTQATAIARSDFA